MRVDPTSLLRMWGYCLVLTAVAFVQEPGRIVGDTKFDLAVDPMGFLARAANLWDPLAAFGQIQNQAYGYFWPMGPFFVLGDGLGLPAWVTQRLWWSLLLCLAFVGTVKVARALDLGRPWAHVVAGFAFALSAHVLTLLGPTSVEAWPTAWAPWVLLPLIHASREGSVRRGAALSALAVAMCGGVNAVAVSAVLPLAVVWLVTRERGPRRLRLTLWWLLFTALATLWWVVPLLLLGRYSVPFLDYIENAPITTLPTSLPDILGGTSDWVAYISSDDWVAGNLVATTPILLVNAAVLAGAGLAGIVHRGNPHRHFLFLGLLVGVALVGFGYTGPLHGWWADDRLLLLDQGLAPFRNLHKYDVVLRLTLVLGLAHFLTLVAESARTASDKTTQRMVVLVTVVSVVGVAAPAYAGRLAPAGSFDAVPEYWHEAADYLAENRRGVALEIPATPFGDYRWGSPRDDVLQPLAASPWAVRNIIPLAQPGNVRFLDAVTAVVESGRPSPALAAALASSGVGHLVVRNDVSRLRSATPDPVVLHQALDRSPGLTKVAEFGPDVGEDAVSYTEEDVRILGNRGRLAPFAAVEVYAVDGARGKVSAWEASTVPVVAGGPGSGLRYDAEVLDGPTVLAGDRSRPFRSSPTVLTDGLRRREMAFTAVRDNESATLGPGEPWTLPSVLPNHRIYENQARFETQAHWAGVESVRASSAQSEAGALPPVRRDRSPGAAIDGAPGTAWVSTGFGGAVGQWWRVRLERPATPREVTITSGAAVGPPVTRLRITTDAGTRVVDAPPEGSAVTYPLPDGPTDFLEIRAVRVRGGGSGAHFSLAEVGLAGVRAERFLAPPDVFDEPPDHILLAREPERPSCALVDTTTVCDDFWVTSGEERFALRRTVTVADDEVYDVELTATPRRGPGAAERLSRALPVQVETSEPLSHALSGSGLAAIDGDPGTAWVASPRDAAYLRLRWDEPVTLDEIDLDLSEAVPGAEPLEIVLGAERELRVVELEDGRGSFDEIETDDLMIRFSSLEEAYSFEGAQAFPLPVAVGEVSFPGADVPTVDPDEPLDLGCGRGPRVSVDGVVEPTRVVASLAELLTGDPLPVEPCDDGQVTLRAGSNEVHVTRSRFTRPEELRLTRVAASPVAAPERVAVTTTEWTATAREVTVGARETPTLLVVAENINAGWSATVDGRELRPQRVHGWAQGWILPPGGEAAVALRFTPDSTYRNALLAGLAGLVLVGVAAGVPGRRSARAPAGTSRGAAWLVVGLSPLAGGLVAGWAGFLAMGAAVLLGGALRTRSWLLPVAAGACVALAGGAHAVARADQFQMHSQLAQVLALSGFVVAAAAFGANGPEFFRRRKGRSRK